MKRILIIVLIIIFANSALARGGFSGGGRGGFSGGGRSFSSSSRSYSAPRSTSRTVTTTSVSRTSVGRGYGGAGYYGSYGHPMMMGGFGMGYGYSNGLITGMILGNLMHPQGTTVYSGGGYAGNALLYPDGRVVNQEGYQVGTYQNGQFMSQQGGMVAQPAPQPPVPINIGPSPAEVCGWILFGFLVIIMIGVLIA